MSVGRLAWILVVALSLRADPARSQQTAVMTREEFDRLPSTTVFVVNGQRVTKGDVVTRLERVRSGPIARNQALNVEAMNRELARKTTLQVAADNAKVLAMKPQSTAVVQRCPTPRIEAIFHVPPVEPGEEFFIKGCGFGGEGKARLELAEKTVDLTAVEWKADYIHVRVPADLVGVTDQQGGTLKVFPPGQVSQPWSPIAFRATHVLMALDRADASVDCFGTNSVDDNCNQNFVATVAARHTHSSFGFGSDHVQVPQLKNGWKYTDSNLEHSCASNATTCWGEAVAAELDPGTGAQATDVVFVYGGSGLAELRYRYNALLEGPLGVPYK